MRKFGVLVIAHTLFQIANLEKTIYMKHIEG